MGSGMREAPNLHLSIALAVIYVPAFFSGGGPDAVASDGGSVEIMYSFVAGLLPKANHKRLTPGPFI